MRENSMTWKSRKQFTPSTQVPGIELANFATNKAYTDRYENIRGIGVVIFYDFIRVISMRIAEMVGAGYLYIFALPYESLIHRYQESYHFKRFDTELEDSLHKRIKPYYDGDCIFMYQKL